MTDEKPSFRRFVLANVMFLCAETVLLLVTTPLFGLGPESPSVFAALGFQFAQGSLAASWIGFGPGRLSRRLFGAVVLLFATFLIAAGVISSGRAPREVIVLSLFANLGQTALILASLVALKIWLSVRLIVDHAGQESSRVMQFHIRHLFVTTTLIAVLLGVARAMLLRFPISSGPELPRLLGIFGLFVGFNLLLTWPAIWSFLTADHLAWKMVFAIAVAAGVTWLEGETFFRLHGASPPRDDGPLWFLNGSQFAVLAAHLLATRWAKFRLVRHGVRAKFDPPDPK